MVLAAGITDINVALSVWTALTFAILIVVLLVRPQGILSEVADAKEVAA